MRAGTLLKIPFFIVVMLFILGRRVDPGDLWFAIPTQVGELLDDEPVSGGGAQ